MRPHTENEIADFVVREALEEDQDWLARFLLPSTKVTEGPDDDRNGSLKTITLEYVRGLVRQRTLYLVETHNGVRFATINLDILSQEDREVLLSGKSIISEKFGRTPRIGPKVKERIPEVVFIMGLVKCHRSFYFRSKNIRVNGVFHDVLLTGAAVEVVRHAMKTGKIGRKWAILGGCSYRHARSVSMNDEIFAALQASFGCSDFALMSPNTVPGKPDQDARMAISAFDTVKSRRSGVGMEAPIAPCDSRFSTLPCPVATFATKAQKNGIPCKVSLSTSMVAGGPRPVRLQLMPKESVQVMKAIQLKNTKGASDESHSIGFDVSSTGMSWGRRISQQRNIVRLRLSGLKRILRLDLVYGYVQIEPGVTQEMLSDILEGTGWCFPGTGSRKHSSVIGNTLGAGFTLLDRRIELVRGLRGYLWNGRPFSCGTLAPLREGELRAASDAVEHGCTYLGGLSPANFLFGKQGVVTEAVFSLRRVPEWVSGGVVAVGNDFAHVSEMVDRFEALKKGSVVLNWQTRLLPTGKDVMFVYYLEASSKRALEEKSKLVKNTVSEVYKGASICKATQTISGPTNDSGKDGGYTIEGAQILPPEKFRALLETLSKGVLRCDDHRTVHTSDQCNDVPSKGSGFKVIAFYAPICKNVIALLNDTIPQIAAKATSSRVTFLCTPTSEKSIHGLVRIVFDRTNKREVEQAGLLLRHCEATLKLMRLPIIRCGASTNTAHESFGNIHRSKL